MRKLLYIVTTRYYHYENPRVYAFCIQISCFDFFQRVLCMQIIDGKLVDEKSCQEERIFSGLHKEMKKARKTHRYADFKRKKSISNCKETVIDALLMMLVYFS